MIVIDKSGWYRFNLAQVRLTDINLDIRIIECRYRREAQEQTRLLFQSHLTHVFHWLHVVRVGEVLINRDILVDIIHAWLPGCRKALRRFRELLVVDLRASLSCHSHVLTR